MIALPIFVSGLWKARDAKNGKIDMGIFAIVAYPILALTVVAMSDDHLRDWLWFVVVVGGQTGIFGWLKSLSNRMHQSETMRSKILCTTEKAAERADVAADEARKGRRDLKVETKELHEKMAVLVEEKTDVLNAKLAEYFASRPASAKKPVILICEDEPDLQILVKRILSRHSMDFETAVTAQEAMQILIDNPPAVALIDLNLPDAPGETVIKRIREMSLNCYVVVMSAAGHRTDEAMQLGADAAVSKPFDVEYLESVVNDGIRKTGSNQ